MSSGVIADPQEPWFAGRSEAILLHRINRRPFTEPSLFSRQPESFREHLMEVLLFGDPVITGRRHRREWHLGNREVSRRGDVLSGQIGWMRTDLRTSDRYNMEERRWEDAVEDSGASARAPFVIDLNSRILGVLQHGSFSPKTVATVFQKLLRRGEEHRAERSTEWSVEPILDEGDFFAWLRDVDSVTRITMTAKLPNPDALPDFDPVWRRMQLHKARLLREVFEAADQRLGLQNLDDDEQIRAFLAMGANAFGYVVADGERADRKTRYDQREKAARERTPELPATWSGVVHIMVDMVKERLRRGARQT